MACAGGRRRSRSGTPALARFYGPPSPISRRAIDRRLRAGGPRAPAFPQSVLAAGRSLAVPLLAFAAPALAMPPEVTLTSPVRPPGGQPAVVRGHRGQAGVGEPRDRRRRLGGRGRRRQAAAGRQRAASTARPARSAARSPTALPDGTYTARARQRNSEQETGYSAPLVFTIGAAPIADADPDADARRRRPRRRRPAAAAADADARPPRSRRPGSAPAPYVCASRRDFTKHVFRPVRHRR